MSQLQPQHQIIKDVETGGEPAVVKHRVIDRNVKIALVVLFYFSSSMALVFMNKRMFSALGKEFPLFVTWWQFVVALVLIAIGGEIGKTRPNFKFFAPVEFRQDVAWKVAPVTIMFIAMVVFNNLCLKYVQVSFYQVARSLTILFSIVFTYFLLSQRTSLMALGCCAIVVVGFAMGSLGEVDFSFLGWTFGVVSSIFVALYGIYVKRALNVLNNDSDILLVYNTILSIVFLLPLIVLSGEWQAIFESPVLRDPNAWVELTIAGVFGLLINIATYLQISLTSALTHNISGTAKACAQTVLGVIIYKNDITALGVFGILLVIGGSAAYTYVRKLEQDRKDAEQTGSKH